MERAARASFDPTSGEATEAILQRGNMAFREVRRDAASLALVSFVSVRAASVASAAALRRSARGEERKLISSW